MAESTEVGGTVAERLTAQRERLGVTRHGLSKLAGVSHETMRNLEEGRVPYPRIDTLEKLATALGCETRDLVP